MTDHPKFQLLNEWLHTMQLPNETLTNYGSRQQVARDRFVTSLGARPTVEDFANVVQAAFMIKNLQQDQENADFKKRVEDNHHTTVKLIGEKFSAEQTRGNTKANEEGQGLLAQGGRNGGRKCQAGKGSRPSCDHCGNVGHIELKCWDKFPHLKKEAMEPRAAEAKAKKDATPTPSSFPSSSSPSTTSAAARVTDIFDYDTDS